MSSLAATVRSKREDLHLTQSDLADQSGISRETISLIERGKAKNPGRGTLEPLAQALGIDPGELLSLAPPLPKRTRRQIVKKGLGIIGGLVVISSEHQNPPRVSAGGTSANGGMVANSLVSGDVAQSLLPVLGFAGDLTPVKLRTQLPFFMSLTYEGQAKFVIAQTTQLIAQVRPTTWEKGEPDILARLYLERALAKIEDLGHLGFGSVLADVEKALKEVRDHRWGTAAERETRLQLERRADRLVGSMMRCLDEEIEANNDERLVHLRRRCNGIASPGSASHPLLRAFETSDPVDRVWVALEQMKWYARTNVDFSIIEEKFDWAVSALDGSAFRSGPAALIVPFFVFEARARNLIRVAGTPPRELQDALGQAQALANLRVNRFQLDLTRSEGLLTGGKRLDGLELLKNLEDTAPDGYQAGKLRRLQQKAVHN